MGSLSFCTGLCGRVAQLVEHRTFNPVVAGSIPAPFTIHCAFSARAAGVGESEYVAGYSCTRASSNCSTIALYPLSLAKDSAVRPRMSR